MNDVGVLGWHDSLNKDSHEDLVEVYTEFLHGEECSLIELTCPYLLDREPSLTPLILLNAEAKELFLKVFHVHVRIVELEGNDEFLTLDKHLVHLPDTLDSLHFLN